MANSNGRSCPGRRSSTGSSRRSETTPLDEKGDERRRIGLLSRGRGGLGAPGQGRADEGSLFRARRHSRKTELGDRNRRIGEFLKELDLTEGRSTGMPKIRGAVATNGSPPPLFSTDEGRTYFLVELPVHPKLAGLKAHDEAHQELTESEAKILSFVADRPRSRPEIAGHLDKSIDRLRGLGLVELTIPDKPRSRNQKSRLAEEGAAWLAAK